MREYDVLVIGSGPAGQKAAIAAAKLGKQVAIVERSTDVGGSCLGQSATELIHIGQAVIDHAGTVDYLRDAVFNYPTLAEAYKVAALDGCNRL